MSRQFVRVGPSPPRPSMRARSAHALLPRASQNLVQVSRVQQSTCGHEGKLPSSRTGVGTNSNARGIQGVDGQYPLQRLSGDTTTSLSRCLCCVCVCVCVALGLNRAYLARIHARAQPLFFHIFSSKTHTVLIHISTHLFTRNSVTNVYSLQDHTSHVPYHILGHPCGACGSFNTSVTAGPFGARGTCALVSNTELNRADCLSLVSPITSLSRSCESNCAIGCSE